MPKKKDKPNPLVGKIVEYEGEEYLVSRVGSNVRGYFVWLRDRHGAAWTIMPPADLDTLKVVGKGKVVIQ